MSETSIEILGQKLSYPATWQGTTAIGLVCVCVAFLGYTLDAEELDSYSNLFNTTTQDAYDTSVDTTAILNEQVISLQAKIQELSDSSNLSDDAKTVLNQELDVIAATQEQALASLQTAHNKVSEVYYDEKDNLDPDEVKDYLERIKNKDKTITDLIQITQDRPKFRVNLKPPVNL